ncbi:hypothetical protein QQ045_025989 [Rhodiola kirilowii]
MDKLLPTHEPLKFVPDSYIHLPDIRPGKVEFPVCNDVPVIDLAQLDHNRVELVSKLLKAGQDIGIFFLINHGIPEELLQDILNVSREFHELPVEDRAKIYSEDKTKTCRLYSSLDYDKEKVHYWRNILVHQECQPKAGNNDCFPENPTRFRELGATYAVELRKVFAKLVELLCEGLEIDTGHYSELVMERQKLVMNYYPPCPNPTLVLGLPKHDDINPMTILAEQTEYHGYQILRNGEWVELNPPPNSLIVNFGYTFEVISNGKIKGDVHRVVLDKKHTRMVVAGSIHPDDSSVIEPAKELINDSNQPRYAPSLYKDLQESRKAGNRDGRADYSKIQA